MIKAIFNIDDLAEFGVTGYEVILNIPEGIERIEKNALLCCEADRIRIPASVTYIGDGALSACPNLEGIDVAEGNAAYCSRDGVLYTKDEKTLVQYPTVVSVDTVAVPRGTEHIGYGAFLESTAREIILPDSLISIGGYAFAGTKLLSKINLPTSLLRLGEGAFSFASAISEIEVPCGISKIETFTFRGCRSLKRARLAKGVRSIGFGAFEHCGFLTEISLPDTVEKIDESAFFCCRRMPAIKLPTSLTEIGYTAFDGCAALETVTVPAAVRKIGICAFDAALPSIYFESPSGWCYYEDEGGEHTDIPEADLCGNAAELILELHLYFLAKG
ncbi:MAG: leucine-rich repeat protein [Clostridia bacterium]|nr:leucine-rich repeat protein [Clostridia bacterium]